MSLELYIKSSFDNVILKQKISQKKQIKVETCVTNFEDMCMFDNK